MPRTGPELSPLTLVRGRWPQGAGEVAIDKAAARDAGFRLGDPIRVATRGPAKEYRIAGLVQLGGAASLGGATVAMFDLRTAQSLFRKAGRLDVVRVTAADGVEDAQLLRTIRPELPPATQLRTADAQAQAESGDTSEGLGFLRYFLLAFGGVALFVGSFVIANTLSITIAQRTRELATLRTLGASRRQVLTSVVVEAVAGRGARVRRRPLRGPRAGAGPQRPAGRRGHRPALERGGAGHAHDRRQPARGRAHHARGQRPAGGAGHPRGADRGRSARARPSRRRGSRASACRWRSG
jgi:hypothetical protein